ncbi:MAG: hypothetical protein KAS70_04450 [Planctomycetes bacterium]|nr:hypothetical protein [Planctomycetota bacterium]
MTAANIFAWILFGAIGLAAFMIGKRRSAAPLLIIGILLMGYPYFISDTLALYLIGVLLTVSLFVFRGK